MALRNRELHARNDDDIHTALSRAVMWRPVPNKLAVVIEEICSVVTLNSFIPDQISSRATRANENLWENGPEGVTAYNLVVCPPKVTKLKTVYKC